LHALDQ